MDKLDQRTQLSNNVLSQPLFKEDAFLLNSTKFTRLFELHKITDNLNGCLSKQRQKVYQDCKAEFGKYMVSKCIKLYLGVDLEDCFEVLRNCLAHHQIMSGNVFQDFACRTTITFNWWILKTWSISDDELICFCGDFSRGKPPSVCFTMKQEDLKALINEGINQLEKYLKEATNAETKAIEKSTTT